MEAIGFQHDGVVIGYSVSAVAACGRRNEWGKYGVSIVIIKCEGNFSAGWHGCPGLAYAVGFSEFPRADEGIGVFVFVAGGKEDGGCYEY